MLYLGFTQIIELISTDALYVCFLSFRLRFLSLTQVLIFWVTPEKLKYPSLKGGNIRNFVQALKPQIIFITFLIFIGYTGRQILSRCDLGVLFVLKCVYFPIGVHVGRGSVTWAYYFRLKSERMCLKRKTSCLLLVALYGATLRYHFLKRLLLSDEADNVNLLSLLKCRKLSSLFYVAENAASQFIH